MLILIIALIAARIFIINATEPSVQYNSNKRKMLAEPADKEDKKVYDEGSALHALNALITGSDDVSSLFETLLIMDRKQEVEKYIKEKLDIVETFDHVSIKASNGKYLEWKGYGEQSIVSATANDNGAANSRWKIYFAKIRSSGRYIISIKNEAKEKYADYEARFKPYIRFNDPDDDEKTREKRLVDLKGWGKEWCWFVITYNKKDDGSIQLQQAETSANRHNFLSFCGKEVCGTDDEQNKNTFFHFSNEDAAFDALLGHWSQKQVAEKQGAANLMTTASETMPIILRDETEADVQAPTVPKLKLVSPATTTTASKSDEHQEESAEVDYNGTPLPMPPPLPQPKLTNPTTTATQSDGHQKSDDEEATTNTAKSEGSSSCSEECSEMENDDCALEQPSDGRNNVEEETEELKTEDELDETEAMIIFIIQIVLTIMNVFVWSGLIVFAIYAYKTDGDWDNESEQMDEWIAEQNAIFAIEEKNKNALISAATLDQIKYENRHNPLSMPELIEAMHKKLREADRARQLERKREKNLRKRKNRKKRSRSAKRKE